MRRSSSICVFACLGFAWAASIALHPIWAADPPRQGGLPIPGSLAEDLAEGERLAAEAAEAAATAGEAPDTTQFNAITPASSLPDPLNSLAASDPATLKAQAEFAVAIEKAEAAYKAARRAAAEKRLAFVKSRVAYHTSQGNFEVAIVAKAAQVQLETSGVDVVRPRPTDTVRFGGHTYALIKESVTWHVAKKRCEEMGGHLVTIEKPQELSFVVQLGGTHEAWIGIQDELAEGDWRDVQGFPCKMPPSNIDNTTGSEHWLHWSGTAGMFNDHQAGLRIMYICEWD